MPSPTSLPAVQPQPNDPFYSVSKLNKFTLFTRALYLSAFGLDAVTGDSSKRPKNWFDTSLDGPDTDTVSYRFVDTSIPGKPTMSAFSLTKGEARAVNLPGYHAYPPYVVPPTNAYVITTTTGIQNSVNVKGLSTYSEAVALAKAWGLDATDGIQETVLSGPDSIVYPPSELRRLWTVDFKGRPRNVGLFLWEMNSNGAGTPGRWDLSGPEPNWISTMPSTQLFVLPGWPVPVRELLDNEALAPSSLLVAGAGAIVYRKDMPSSYNTNYGGPGGGPISPSGGGVSSCALTPDIAARLVRIEKGIDNILVAATLPVPE